MDSQKQQAAERIKQANNILVTVSSNPSVDQLAACIGLTLAFNKMGKHATAVFSGAVPSTIEFLQPEKTLEKNTDSLRDFIIALDKSKADKLRYKVEDRVVKIFITPYRTSINEKDLEFSQGDFNVDVVMALGVHNQVDLDQTITSHGRILHDATVITVNVKPGGELGGINWLDPSASSLSELAVQLVDVLDKKLVDNQIATAFLTGIVAETDRFSNAHTSPQTMSISAELMGAGANQQLVATKLEEPATPPPAPVTPIASQQSIPSAQPAAAVPAEKPADGTLEIAHDDKPETVEPQLELPKPEPAPEPEPEQRFEPIAPQIHIDEHGALSSLEPEHKTEEGSLPPPISSEPSISHHDAAPKMILEPPTIASQPISVPAQGVPGAFGAQSNDMGLPQTEIAMPTRPSGPLLPPQMGTAAAGGASDDEETPSGGAAPTGGFIVGEQPAAPKPPLPMPNEPDQAIPSSSFEDNKTLTDIERDVHSNHLGDIQSPVLNTPPAFAPPANTGAPTDSMQPPIPIVSPIAPANTPAVPAFADNTVPVNPIPTGTSPIPTGDMLAPDVTSARDAVAQAIDTSAQPSGGVLDVHAGDLPLGGTVNDVPAGGIPPSIVSPTDAAPVNPVMPDQTQPWNTPVLDQTPLAPFEQNNGQLSQDMDPNAPPPVPPPMMPPTNPY
jgi:hypothetical protein